MKRNKLFLVDHLKEHKYSFLNSPVIQMQGSAYEVPFPIEPTKGSHSLESCENCRKHKLILIEEINEKFEKFPGCCEYHKNLINRKFFNKDDFKDIGNITANKVMFAYHHIINNLDNDDWYSDIIAYLNYCIASFGVMPLNCGEPFQLSNFHSHLLSLLETIEKEINSDNISLVEIRTRMNKIKKLIVIDNKPLAEESKVDLNLLLTMYDEWFKAFPFDLPYFKHLEQPFKKLMPLHNGRSRYNKYLGITEHEPHTKESLTVFLLQTTQNILTNINGAKLYEKDLLNNTEKIGIDLVIENRKLELLELSKMPNSKKYHYIKVLKKWFKGEKKFIKEITPMVKTLPPSEANFTFINKFDKAESNKVYEHFYKLVEKGYLSKIDLENYLKLAFQDKTQPKEKISFSNKHIGNITTIFYKYYADADNTHGKQKKYAELLGEYFNDFTTKKVMNNFAKSK